MLYEGSEGKGAPQIGLRLPPAELTAVDNWIAQQPKPRPSRPVAIRRLIEMGLLAGAGSADVRAKASESASQARKLAGELGLKAKAK